MIVLRFRGQLQPERAAEALAAFEDAVAPSRKVEGVISYDIAQDIIDPNAIIAVEVFEDQTAVDLQDSLPEVVRLMRLLPSVLAAPPESTKFYVSSAEARV
jgi:quinol monooxygenase YgiN